MEDYEIINYIKIDNERLNSMIDEEIDSRFKDICCHIFVDENGIEWLEFFSDTHSDFMKRVKLKEVDRIT